MKAEYRISRTRKELEQSFALVYAEYCNRGYILADYKSKLRLSLYNALPSTTTFIAKEGKKVLATVTLVGDSPLGLPMDKIYKKECDGLRKKGKLIAEVSQLSIDSNLFPKGWFSMFNFSKLIFVFKLFKLVFDYARSVAKIDELCIAVNPKHQYLYKFLFFTPLGKLKYYSSVNRAPALAFHLSLDPALRKKVSAQRRALHKIFYGKNTDPEVFKNKFVFKISDVEYFFLEKSNILTKATEKQLEYIKGVYRWPELDRIIEKYK